MQEQVLQYLTLTQQKSGVMLQDRVVQQTPTLLRLVALQVRLFKMGVKHYLQGLLWVLQTPKQ